MNQLEGNLILLGLQGEVDIIVQGNNCYHKMGSGFAKSIAETFPEALEADKKTPWGDKRKLGTYSMATVSGDRLPSGRDLIIINAYTQFRYSRYDVCIDLPAVSSVFKKIAADFPNAHIGYPQIGSGLAGGSWDEIYPIICQALEGRNHTFVKYSNKKTHHPNQLTLDI